MPSSSTRPAWPQAERRQTKGTSSGSMPSLHICLHSRYLQQFMRASCSTLGEHPLCSHILHKCWPGYSLQKYLTHNYFEWSAHEYSCPLQVQLELHMHSATPQKWQGAPLPVAFLKMVPVPCALDYITWRYLMEEHSTSIVHAPTSCMHIYQTIPNRDI